MKLIDLLNKHYDLFKEEYNALTERLPIAREELTEEENKLIEQGISYHFQDYENRYKCFKYDKIKNEIEEINKNIPILKNNMIKINEILNNSERLISLKRNELDKFSYNKIILDSGTLAEGNSNSNINGNIKGGIGGSSFLGFGSIDGSMKSNIDGKSNANYKEYIIIKYKYNLDFEIEEFLFDIDEYIKQEVGE